MNRFELEIPGRICWRFKSVDEAVLRGVKLMVQSISEARIYQLNEDEAREGVLLRLEKFGASCPACSAESAVIQFSGMLDAYDDTAVCRVCESRFPAVC